MAIDIDLSFELLVNLTRAVLGMAQDHQLSIIQSCINRVYAFHLCSDEHIKLRYLPNNTFPSDVILVVRHQPAVLNSPPTVDKLRRSSLTLLGPFRATFNDYCADYLNNTYISQVAAVKAVNVPVDTFPSFGRSIDAGSSHLGYI